MALVFKSTLPAKNAALYGLDFSYQPIESDLQYYFNYYKTTSTQNVPSGLTPTKIDKSFESLSAHLFINSIAPEKVENLRLGIGYGIVNISGTDTLPNNVLTNLKTQGVILSVANKFDFMFDTQIETLGSLYLPHQINEGSQITGYNPKYFGGEVKLNVEYVYEENVTFYAGLSYRMDKLSYSGAVNRGVSDAVDKRILITLPIGLKYEY